MSILTKKFINHYINMSTKERIDAARKANVCYFNLCDQIGKNSNDWAIPDFISLITLFTNVCGGKYTKNKHKIANALLANQFDDFDKFKSVIIENLYNKDILSTAMQVGFNKRYPQTMSAFVSLGLIFVTADGEFPPLADAFFAKFLNIEMIKKEY